jgi:hypothetical protein
MSAVPRGLLIISIQSPDRRQDLHLPFVPNAAIPDIIPRNRREFIPALDGGFSDVAWSTNGKQCLPGKPFSGVCLRASISR